MSYTLSSRVEDIMNGKQVRLFITDGRNLLQVSPKKIDWEIKKLII
jgi:hypothetical protein